MILFLFNVQLRNKYDDDDNSLAYRPKHKETYFFLPPARLTVACLYFVSTSVRLQNYSKKLRTNFDEMFVERDDI